METGDLLEEMWLRRSSWTSRGNNNILHRSTWDSRRYTTSFSQPRPLDHLRSVFLFGTEWTSSRVQLVGPSGSGGVELRGTAAGVAPWADGVWADGCDAVREDVLEVSSME